MWEDLYQVYKRYGEGKYDLRASDMTIDDALLFVKTIFSESFNEDALRFEIRRQPMDYIAGADNRLKEEAMEEFMYGQDMGNPDDGSL